MLYFSMLFSALLLLIANWIVRRGQYPGTKLTFISLGVIVAPFFVMCVLPAVALQSIFSVFAVIVWRISRRGPSFFLRLSVAATLIAYGLAGILVFRSEREYARLRAMYAFESMEGRVSAPKPWPGGTPLPAEVTQRMARLEDAFPEHKAGWRASQLKRLHEAAVELFIDSPGFGMARMFYPAEWNLAPKLDSEPTPLQPRARFTAEWSPGELAGLPAGDEELPGQILEDSFVDFVNPVGFGYVKDRRRVAGFASHRFSRIPGPSNRWTLRTLELVSLLLHDEPEVYVSDRLPQMSKVRDVATRPLDRFERLGLDTLRRGEDLLISRGEEGIRMLGAVRSIKQCVACHGGERGDLLGAFSYNLRTD